MAEQKKLVHYMRVRTSDDLRYLQGGLCDELIVNANQLENSAQATAAHLRGTGYGYMIDPVLWRFQVPEWRHNEKGETKRNYRRLAKRYAQGTSISMVDGRLLDTVQKSSEWEQLATNVIAYQRERLDEMCRLDLLDPLLSRELRPSRFVAPALVAQSRREDDVNHLLIEAAAAAAGEDVVGMVIIPRERLNMAEIGDLLKTVPDKGVRGFVLWTPGMTEDHLVATHDAFAALVTVIQTLARRGVPVIQTQLGYAAAAMSMVGLSGVAHHLGWVDRGEPASESGGGPRSCQAYVPGVRTVMRFNAAASHGRQLGPDEYRDRFCECAFCMGLFERGEHPLDVLLEDQAVGESTRRTPSSRATGANIWHYLLSRRLEVQAFSSGSVDDVIGRDIDRAAALAGAGQASWLERLAEELHAA